MQEGAKTPTLYTIYGKQYDFNELQQTADRGLAEHLASLKRGSKDESQFRDAYNNIMIGIKDGSITYQDGRFIDTKYGYHNSTDKDKNKDHYGLMANYIFSKMGRSPEYVKPEDKTKTKWEGSASVGKALIRELYNSDTENIRDFIDVDGYDEATKSRATTGRTNRLSKAFQTVLSNFDNLFTGYTPADRANAEAYINDAINYLNDGRIDAGDYLALSRAASGLNYRGMFGEYTPQDVPSQNVSTESSSAQTGSTQAIELFQQFMDQNYPRHTFTSGNPLFDYNAASKIQLSPEAQSAFNKVLSSMSDEQLQDILRRYIRTPNEATPFQIKVGNNVTPVSNAASVVQILNYLKNNNKLSAYNFGESDLGSYYLPGSWKKGGVSGLVWDTTTGKISEMDYLKIPYLRQQIAEEFNQWRQNKPSETSTAHWLDSYGFYKEGGVIKASTGTKFDNILDAITYTADDLADARRFRNLFQNGMINNMALRGDTAATDETAKYNRAYDPELGGKETEAQDWWNSWVQLLTSREDLAEAWAKRYLDLNKTTDRNNNLVHGQNWFNPDGTFNFKNFQQTVSPVSQKAYWSDQNNGIGHDFYRGRVYQIEGQDGYYQGLLNGYELVGDPKLDSGNLAYIYTMRRKAQPAQDNTYPNGVNESYDGSDFNEVTGGTEPYTGSTDIHLTTGDGNKSGRSGQNFLNVLGNLAPDILGAGRLALSLNTNNRVAKTIKPTLTPVLKNTYERFSPITGDWYTRQSGYRRAGDTQSRFSKPITSDASLYANIMLDANRQATALQTQADAADNQEIKRTAAEALTRVEDNMARRSEVANFNRASMNQTNRERAQLEASRLKSNWQSWDNYLQGIESRFRQKQQEREMALRNATAESIETDYRDAIRKLDNLYKEANPNATTTTMLDDSNYNQAISDLQLQRRYRRSRIGLDMTDPFSNYKPRSFNDIIASYKFKSGGQLNPSASYLINKVIRNENNT